MKTPQFALIVGLTLGIVLAVCSIPQFLLVVLFGAVGLTVGMLLDGRLDLRALIERSRR